MRRPDAPLVVGVQPESALRARARLFAALTAALDVRFTPSGTGAPACDALVVVGGSPAAAEQPPVPVLLFAAEEAVPGLVEDVAVGRGPGVDRRLHGVRLPAACVAPALVPEAGDEVLAVGLDGPVWTRRPGPAPLDRVRAVLPSLGDDEGLRDGLWGPHAFALVALVSFLRALDGDRWAVPPLRAAFVFDDPNLRRTTYGHLDYHRLVQHADAHGYHAAMATIPLDAGLAHGPAAALFRTRPERLSLVVHGNDHTRDELMQPREPGTALALGAQALRRIGRLEARTGLRVDRVMMPPHGLCSRAVVAALGLLGYEGLAAIHPSPWTERPEAGRLLAGWTPAELLDGCAVLPRFPLDAGATEIALRAFLGQPLILYAHHGDVADGLEPLAEAAARVNALGDVRWTSLREIARAGWSVTERAGTATVRPWARRMDVVLPDGATTLTVVPGFDVERAGMRGWSVTPAGHALTGGATAGGPPHAVSGSAAAGVPVHDFGETVPVPAGGGVVRVELRPVTEIDPGTVADPPGRAWPLVRRRVTEARDRLAPHTTSRRRRRRTERTP